MPQILLTGCPDTQCLAPLLSTTKTSVIGRHYTALKKECSRIAIPGGTDADLRFKKK